jgi:chemotaxis protein MotB
MSIVRLGSRTQIVKALALAALAGGLGVGGCANQDRYDAVVEANRALQARNSELAEQLRQCQEASDALTGRIGAGDRTLADANATNARLRQELADRDAQLKALSERLGGIQFGPLDEATDRALADLAAKYPGVLSYDSARGMLRFTSDVTFASGSFELTAQGQQTVAELGRILLQVPTAGQYDVYVVGHTDTQRVRQVAGRRFINNDELSAFRAISVHNALTGAGVAKNKVMFAGFGESRPVADRGPNANVAQNRRVEVFLAKSTLGAGNAAASSAPAPAAPAAPARPAVNPDTIK